MSDWKIFHGDNRDPHPGIDSLPDAPGWRPFGKDIAPGVSRRKRRGETFQARPEEVEMVNAALYLRRPLLVTGRPGVGKSSLAYSVARELDLGEVLYWPISTRTNAQDGLYTYDAIGRLQEAKEKEGQGHDDPQTIAKYITLGPLGTALLPSERPRVLVIDEIDKSDIDLPNNLLTIFEEGRFEIKELARLQQYRESDQPMSPVTIRTSYSDDDAVTEGDRTFELEGERITCKEFPLVIMTSNGERDFPPPFLRRCLRLNMRDPSKAELEKIINVHLNDDTTTEKDEVQELLTTFIERRKRGALATDQLLNAVFLITQNRDWVGQEKENLMNRLLKNLDSSLDSVDPK